MTQSQSAAWRIIFDDVRSLTLLTRESPPPRIELDVSQAKRLELTVNDGGNGLEADHADWVDAVLWP